MILSDGDLSEYITRGEIEIIPWKNPSVQPASYDVHLGRHLLALPKDVVIDPEQDQRHLYQTVELRTDGRWLLEPGRGYLSVTEERVSIGENTLGLLHGVSSVGRLWLLIHVTAGLVDPGYRGYLTLELVALGNPILLRPGMRIGQLTFHQLTTPPVRLYTGRYQHDELATPSRAYLDYQS